MRIERYIIVKYGTWIAKPCGQGAQLFRMREENWFNDEFMFESLSQAKSFNCVRYPGFRIVKVTFDDKIEE